LNWVCININNEFKSVRKRWKKIIIIKKKSEILNFRGCKISKKKKKKKERKKEKKCWWKKMKKKKKKKRKESIVDEI